MVNRHPGPRVGVVGSCNVDLVVRCEHLARPGETILGGDVERAAGGKGANQAAAAAHLGATVTMVASVGRDDEGDWLLEKLAGHGVITELVSRSSRPTGTAFITVENSGENQIVVSLGANQDLDVRGIDLDPFDVVLAQLEITASAIDDVARRSRRLILNAAPARPVDPLTLRRCDVVIANEIEAEQFDLAALEHCVLTLGARGAVHYRRGCEVARVAAKHVVPVDTVGAGDVFCAAYAVASARGGSDEDVLGFAVAAGSLATLARGAQGALPTTEEVRQWLARE